MRFDDWIPNISDGSMDNRQFRGRLGDSHLRSRKTPLLLGIPVLNRIDLLVRALESVDEPCDVIIINNARDHRELQRT